MTTIPLDDDTDRACHHAAENYSYIGLDAVGCVSWLLYRARNGNPHMSQTYAADVERVSQLWCNFYSSEVPDEA